MIKTNIFESYKQTFCQVSEDYSFDFKTCGTILLISAAAHMSLAGLALALTYQGYQSYVARFGFINESSRFVDHFLAKVKTSDNLIALTIRCQQGFLYMDKTMVGKAYNQTHLQSLVKRLEEERIMVSESNPNVEVQTALDQIHTSLTRFLISQNLEEGWVETGAEKELIEAETQKREPQGS